MSVMTDKKKSDIDECDDCEDSGQQYCKKWPEGDTQKCKHWQG